MEVVLKTYKFFIMFDAHIIYAKNIRSALSQLKKEVGLKYYNLRSVYVVNDQVRYLKEDFMKPLIKINEELNGEI